MARLVSDKDVRLTLSFGGSNLPYRAMTAFEYVRLDAMDPIDWMIAARTPILQACSDLHQLVAANDCMLTSLTVKLGPEDTGPTLDIPVGVEGENGANACPPNVALLVRKLVPTVSGRLNGRSFYPSISEGNVANDGTIPTPALGPYQEAFDDFFTAMTEALPDGPNLEPVVFGGGEGGGPVNTRRVVRYTVQPRVATRRRRLRR